MNSSENPLIFRASLKHLQADTYTPVGIYLRLRDRFPQSLLLECADYSSRQDSFSYICLQPLAGVTLEGNEWSSYSTEGSKQTRINSGSFTTSGLMEDFLSGIRIENEADPRYMPGVFGYTTYDAVNFFDNVNIMQPGEETDPIPLMRYDLYQVVIAFNHFNNTLTICELLGNDTQSKLDEVLSLLANRNATSFPFAVRGQERNRTSEKDYKEMVGKGIAHCARGDVFQIVLSRRFEQDFAGDEFNVYRALRSVNPSPYLFYFDYLSYKLFGSSPEAQLRISQNRATINPIAGTVARTGDPPTDAALVEGLLKDQKENAEHCMLVDLARNDLSKHTTNVKVDTFREVQSYSHVTHLVSTVSGALDPSTGKYQLFADTFPAGTLSGAPKHQAMRLIDRYESHARGFYGGAIGFLGLNGSLNHAIMIRSFLSRKGTLHYQAGAGVVIDSDPEGELEEVNGKTAALKNAIQLAGTFSQ